VSPVGSRALCGWSHIRRSRLCPAIFQSTGRKMTFTVPGGREKGGSRSIPAKSTSWYSRNRLFAGSRVPVRSGIFFEIVVPTPLNGEH
jgi:hypothetical protein